MINKINTESRRSVLFAAILLAMSSIQLIAQENPYQVIYDWGELPGGRPMGVVTGVQPDPDGELLHKRGILYAPDYVINAGGIINAGSEIGGVYYPTRARELTERIYETTEDVIKTSRVEGIPTSTAANRLAERRIKAVQSLKKIRPRDF